MCNWQKACQTNIAKIHAYYSNPLEPDLIKALIASESSFHANTNIPAGKGQGRARGLMQVTDGTMHILSDHHGELSNFLFR